MGHLHQIVDLATGADSRLAQQPTIHRAVGTDLDIVFENDSATVFELDVGIVMVRIPESIATHHYTGMKNAALTNPRVCVKNDPGIQNRVPPDTAIAADDNVGMDLHS